MSTTNAKQAADGKPKSSTPSSQPQNNNPPLTAAEKQWLKAHHGDEYHFLREQGLSIYKEEDRAEGRSILRAFMEEDEDEADPDDGNGEEENQFLRDLEEDPTSHVADYHFSAKELEWIEAHYRHSGQFLLSYGLKPFDDEDCREGKAMVQQMMEG
ncbi:hypothetical protein G7Y79_00027g061280 [Physcia stellaris]|nr:hypothetical protein G7Y79_00027g061280 [Physcia stellaris]